MEEFIMEFLKVGRLRTTINKLDASKQLDEEFCSNQSPLLRVSFRPHQKLDHISSLRPHQVAYGQQPHPSHFPLFETVRICLLPLFCLCY